MCCSQFAGVAFLSSGVGTAQARSVSPSFALSLSWERGYLPWRRCRCRRGARMGTSGHRAGT